VYVLLEVDVTLARQWLRAHRERTGERLSFTAWLIAVFESTLAEHPPIHAFRLGHLWRSTSDAVDVSTLVERPVDGQLVPVPTLIRAADRLDVAATSRALDDARQGPVSAGASWLAGPAAMAVGAWVMALLPGFVRRAAWRLALSVPWVARGVIGSAVVSSVGMMGQIRGWFLQTSIHPVSLGVGSIVRKPLVMPDDVIEPRDVLHLTLLMDHDVVDGADMARFVAAFVAHLESVRGLEVDREPAPVEGGGPAPQEAARPKNSVLCQS
jgi:pyruvate/2-oxoglutarate dehydrogenase complex dihydrolipoamide acyltransferase (E2) component